MITAKQFSIIRVLASSGAMTAQEILRVVHTHIPKNQLWEYLRRLGEMGLTAHAVTSEAGKKEYWLTDKGKKAHEYYVFLDSFNHQGRKFGEPAKTARR